MALPKIISKLSQNEKKAQKEYLLAIEIWDSEVKTAIWTVEEGKTKVVALGSRETWSKEEELIEAADKSLSQASERFSEVGQEPSKVIFGLPEKWTGEKEIKLEYRRLLKKLYQKLELKPVGYVLTFDALIHHLKKVDGVPPSAIFVKLAKEKIYLSVVEVGRKVGGEEVKRSENLASDLSEGLVRMTEASTLPSRILLFDGEDMEEARQALIDHQWLKPQAGGKKLPFLHFPKIEILPTDFDVNAVALAGGTEVAKSLGFEIKEEVEEEEVEPSVAKAMEGKEEGEEEGKEEIAVEEGEEDEEALEGEPDFGFVKSKDIQEERPRIEEPSVAEAMEGEEEVEEKKLEPEEVIEEEEVLPPRKTRGLMAPLFALFKKAPKISGLKEIFSAFKPSFLPGGKLIALLVAGAVLVIIGLLFAFVWYFPKAEVTVMVESKDFDEEIRLLVDPNQAVLDEENRVLPGQVLETEVDGESSASTTGEKTVGDKAKGEVTVYNRTDSPKTFEAGTVIVGSGALEFNLDEEVKIASKTPDLSTGVDKWGEAKVGATAAGIGAEYNLAGGAQFSFADYPTSEFLAKNEGDLSGGTSRKIQAVSEEDQEDLLTELSEELKNSAEGELLAQAGPGQSLVKESILTEPISEDFDAEVDDEAQTLRLKLKAKVTGLAFKQEEFLNLVALLMADSTPEGYQLKPDEMSSKFEIEEENEDGSILFKTHVKANLLPALEPSEIAKNIKGKYPRVAQDYLKTIPGYVDSQIVIRPRLPGPLATLPRKEERIKVEIEGQ
jgi:hypothetical protein